MNTYGYVGGNPVNWIDPLGNSAIPGYCQGLGCLFIEGFSSIGDAAAMALSWVSGIGKEHYQHGPGSPMALEMSKFMSINDIRNAYKSKWSAELCSGKSDLTELNYDTAKGAWSWTGPEIQAATPLFNGGLGLNASAHFLGRYTGSIYGGPNGIITFAISNVSGFDSFTGGLLPGWSRDTFPIMGDISQTIYWNETIDTGANSCACP